MSVSGTKRPPYGPKWPRASGNSSRAIERMLGTITLIFTCRSKRFLQTIRPGWRFWRMPGQGMASSLRPGPIIRTSSKRSMTKLLLLGLGRWGVNHLSKLHSMPVELYVAELDAKRLEPARKLGLPEARLTTNYKD